MSPSLTRVGEAVFSTCLAVERWPAVVWDVNGYYHDLGVSPGATRKDLRDAYLARDGHGSKRLTFVLKQLLDPDVRARYDGAPLGSIFIDDYVLSELVREAHMQEYRDRLADHLAGRPAREILREEVSMDDFLAGYHDQERLESDEPMSHPRGTVATDTGRWGFYLGDTSPPDYFIRQEWIHRLVAAFGQVGISCNIAIGFVAHRDSTPGWSRQPDGALVALIPGDAEPDDSVATRLAWTYDDKEHHHGSNTELQARRRAGEGSVQERGQLPPHRVLLAR